MNRPREQKIDGWSRFAVGVFVGLMMMGMMAGVAQFILYLVAIGQANDPASFSAWLNWLGPFRELALGLILAGIVLALVTIGNVLAFQFNRISSIIRGHASSALCCRVRRAWR